MRTEQDSYDTALAMARVMIHGSYENLTFLDVSEVVDRVYKFFGTDCTDEKLRLQPFNIEALKRDLAERFEVQS